MKVNKIGLLDISLFSQKGVLGDSDRKCCVSDLAKLMGLSVSNHVFGQYCIQHPTNNLSKEGIKFATAEGRIGNAFSRTTLGVRICISFDDIEDFNLDDIDNINLEYPINVIDGTVSNIIEKMFKNKSKLLIKTGRKHKIDMKLYDEYEVFGTKFIIYHNNDNASPMLSDGRLANKNTDIYIEVSKIPFIVNEEARLIYSTYSLYVSGFCNKGAVHSCDDEIKYLNEHFIKSINDEYEHEESRQVFGIDKTFDYNRYNFDFSSLTEEEIIEICINSNIAVFLHGKTGTGKTERMLTLDRNLELIDFGCTSSDGFTGIVAKDFNSKELFLYEPYWYKNLCEKCTNEPKRIHILFLEELTNATKDVQKVAFEVTLNKTLTNSGFRLKLPENAVVCAAGNEANESKSANALSEPLFGRFAHVYINTDSEEWLKWALDRKRAGKELVYKENNIPNTIHPSIVDFIRVNGDKVLRTQYNGKTPNADPRKWALASKALYVCNNPNVLRAFVGEDVANEFIEFCKLGLVSVEDVLTERCKPSDVPLDASIRYYTTICLSTVDDENVDKVREFVGQLGKEFLAMFDYNWSKDNDERIMRLYGKYNSSFSKRLV